MAAEHAATGTGRARDGQVDPSSGAPIIFATFAATPHADAPDTAVVVNDSVRSAVVGSVLGDSIAVRVLDRFGNPVVGADVAWSTDDGGALDPAASSADSSGVEWLRTVDFFGG